MNQAKKKDFNATSLVQSNKFNLSLNILNEITVFDYVFPFNKSFLQSNGVEKSELYLFQTNNLFSYKSISAINHDTLEDFYLLDLENFTGKDNQISAQVDNTKHLTNWLNSCNDKKCSMLSSIMENRLQSFLNNKEFSSFFNVLNSNILTKTYIKKLSDQTMKFIKSNVYYAEVHKVDSFAKKDEIVQFQVNQKYLDLVGFTVSLFISNIIE